MHAVEKQQVKLLDSRILVSNRLQALLSQSSSLPHEWAFSKDWLCFWERGIKKPEQEAHLREWGQMFRALDKTTGWWSCGWIKIAILFEREASREALVPCYNPVAFEWYIVRVKLVAHMVKCPHTKTHLNLFQEQTALYKKLPAPPVWHKTRSLQLPL